MPVEIRLAEKHATVFVHEFVEQGAETVNRSEANGIECRSRRSAVRIDRVPSLFDLVGGRYKSIDVGLDRRGVERKLLCRARDVVIRLPSRAFPIMYAPTLSWVLAVAVAAMSDPVCSLR